MAQLPASLLSLVAFFLLLLSLAWFSRKLSYQVQTLFFWLTNSYDAAIIAYFLIFLPGIVVHESAHWVVARLFGLKTSRFRVWPTRRGKSIALGSVNVQSAGSFVDSVVGLAPLLVGTGLIGVIGYHVFGAQAMTVALGQGRWRDGLGVFMRSLGQPDGVLWAYLIFTIANAMMPSPSDREPVKPLLLYIALASALYVVVGLPLDLLSSAVDWLAPMLEIVNSALLFTVILDALVGVVLYTVLRLMRRQ